MTIRIREKRGGKEEDEREKQMKSQRKHTMLLPK